LRSAQISLWRRLSSTIRPGQIRLSSSSLPTSSWRLEQRQQQVEGASAEPYRLAVREQLPAMRQDPEVAEFNDRRRVRRANHNRRL
jgi:hypothetical protein